jgi:hypothetical protein
MEPENENSGAEKKENEEIGQIAQPADQKKGGEPDENKGSKGDNRLAIGALLAIGAIAITAIAYFTFFSPAKLDILLAGPNTGAVENSISIINGKIMLQGTDFDSLKMAGDRLVLIAMGISSTDGLNITTKDNGNIALDYYGTIYEFTTDINQSLGYPVQSEWTIKQMLDSAGVMNIVFDGSSNMDNSYFAVVAFNTVSKLKVFYSSMGKHVDFTSMNVAQ